MKEPQATKRGVAFTVQVVLKASSSEVVGWKEGTLKIRLKAIAEKGKANAELVKTLAKFFDVGVSKVALIQGATSRCKRIEIEGINLEEFWKKCSL